jgi:hypothetical protein
MEKEVDPEGRLVFKGHEDKVGAALTEVEGEPPLFMDPWADRYSGDTGQLCLKA